MDMACYGFLSGDTTRELYSGMFLDPPSERVVEVAGKGKRKSEANNSEAKVLAALKNHSEAERRRRERINSHLATLRGLVQCNDKMDKATLLAEVIKQVKEAKKKAAEASKGIFIPTDYDSVVLDTRSISSSSSSSFNITLCCGYRPEILSDIRLTLAALPIKTIRTEVSTLGDRLKLSFEFIANQNVDGASILVRDALSSIIDKASALAEYSPRSSLASKRRKLNLS